MTFLCLCMFVLNMTAWASNDKPVRIEEMPGQAQKFIKDYFSTHSVAMAKMETDFFSKSYDVIFTNGDKVEFDRKGNWTDVDCKYSVVPVGIVPTEIVKSVKSKYPDAKIIQIERDNRHYDVDLSNGWELKYNKQFKLVDIEK